MTGPVVGQVSVEVLADARSLARSLKSEVEAAFKDVDFSKTVQDSIGKTKIKLPVEPDMDTSGLGEKVRRTKVPKVPVDLDPVLAEFQAQVRREAAALARTVNAKIPVSADTARLRAELGASIAEVQRALKAKIGTEPGSVAEYALKLRKAVDEASAKVKAKIKLEPDKSSSGLSSLGDAAKGIFSTLGGLAGGGGGGGGVFSGLFSGFTGIFSGITSGIGDLAGSLGKASSAAEQAGSSLAGAFSAAAGPIGIAIGLMAAITAGITAATVAAYALGPALGLISAGLAAAAGAAGAIPAALVGGGAVFGTLALGFRGIQEAFKPKTGGGGGGGTNPAQQARQVAAAERGVESARRGIASATRGVQSAERGYQDALQGVTQAQQRAKLAQDAVNRARKEAAEDLEDLERSLRGAQLDEEDATLGVTDALRALNEAKLTGNLPDIQRADLAYRRAQLTLENATDSAQDLGEQQADSAKKGVEGSDKVVSALREQADAQNAVKKAQEGVLDAQNAQLSAADGLKSAYDGLASAQDSLAASQEKSSAGAAAAAAKMIKLAPAAQKFVDAIKALKPAFEALRLDVQQRLFAGLDKTVTNLGKAWIPALHRILGSYADTFNGFFKNLGTSLGKPKFIADIEAGAEGARKGMSKIFDSITTSLVPAFGALSKAAGPFLTQLGKEIAGVVTDFSNWVLQGEKTGALTKFFDRAATAMHELFTTGKTVSQIIGSIFEIITGKDAKAKGHTELEKFNSQLGKLSAYLKDPQNQQKIRDFVGEIKHLADKFLDAGNKASSLLDKFKGIRQMLFGDQPAQAAKDDQTGVNMGGTPLKSDDAKTKTYSFGQDLGAALVLGIITGISGTVTLQNDIIANAIWKGPNSIVGKIKSGLGISSPSTVMMAVGQDMVRGLVNGITGYFGTLAATAVQIKRTVLNRLADAGSWLITHGHNVVIGLINGMASRAGELLSRAAALGNGIINTFRGAGKWLYSAGYNLVVGLWNGINQLSGWLRSNILTWARAVIPGPLWKFFGINSPSKLMMEMGGHLGTGLALGMDAKAAEVQAAAARLAAAALPALGDAGAGLAADLGTVSARLERTGGLTAQWAAGTTGDPLLDAIRRMVKFGYSGDVQAALGTS